MKLLLDPLSIWLAGALLAVLVSSHVKNQGEREKDHYQDEHRTEYDAETELRLKQKEELRKAQKYKLRQI